MKAHHILEVKTHVTFQTVTLVKYNKQNKHAEYFTNNLFSYIGLPNFIYQRTKVFLLSKTSTMGPDPLLLS
jgi:hypothetical protein